MVGTGGNSRVGTGEDDVQDTSRQNLGECIRVGIRVIHYIGYYPSTGY